MMNYYVIIDLIDSMKRFLYTIFLETDYSREKIHDNRNMCIIPSKKTPLMEKLRKEDVLVYPIQRIEKGGNTFTLRVPNIMRRV